MCELFVGHNNLIDSEHHQSKNGCVCVCVMEPNLRLEKSDYAEKPQTAMKFMIIDVNWTS